MCPLFTVSVNLQVGELATAVGVAALAVQSATAGCSATEQGLIACEAARKLHPDAQHVAMAVVAIASAAITGFRPGMKFHPGNQNS